MGSLINKIVNIFVAYKAKTIKEWLYYRQNLVIQKIKSKVLKSDLYLYK